MTDSTQPYDIYIEVNGGCVTAIYGKQIPSDIQLNFIVRDMDSIAIGDPDPVNEDDTDEFVNYW